MFNERLLENYFTLTWEADFQEGCKNHLANEEPSLTLGRLGESMDNHITEEAGARATGGDTLRKAIESYKKTLHIARKAGDRAREGKAYLNLGILYNSRNDLPKANKCFEKALNNAREAGDWATEVDSYFYLAAVLQLPQCFKSYRVC